MEILRGTNWRGDATWHVYDVFAKITVAIFLTEAEAYDFAYRRMMEG